MGDDVTAVLNSRQAENTLLVLHCIALWSVLYCITFYVLQSAVRFIFFNCTSLYLSIYLLLFKNNICFQFPTQFSLQYYLTSSCHCHCPDVYRPQSGIIFHKQFLNFYHLLGAQECEKNEFENKFFVGRKYSFFVSCQPTGEGS